MNKIKENLYLAILAGGSGTRLWPLSRKNYPKQFIRFFNDQSLLQQTLLRNNFIVNQPLIVTNYAQRFLTINQLNEVNGNYKLILEPCAKDSFAACITACLEIYKENPNGILLITPADHIIKDQEQYEQVILAAYNIANKELLYDQGVFLFLLSQHFHNQT